MAAAFKVTNSSEIATAFAAHDEFLSRVAMKANDGQAMTKGMVESTIYYDIFYLLLSFTYLLYLVAHTIIFSSHIWGLGPSC